MPLQLLVGLNIGRVFAVLFLLLAAEGRLSGPFPYSAAWGDIITGAFALPLPSEKLTALGNHIGKPVYFGIRPEDIHDAHYLPRGVDNSCGGQCFARSDRSESRSCQIR